MKAIICTKYGPPNVLQLQNVEKPKPKKNEVLVKIHATSVSTGDCRIRGFNSPLLFWIPMRIILGFRKPRKPILGVELSGEIEDIGTDVTQFKKGDQVFALTELNLGGYAEYTCLHESGLIALKPTNVTYEEAAVIPFGGTSALHFLRKGQIKKGQRVLIYGASGSVGTAAVQLAKYFGATVTAICSSSNFDLVTALGADNVIDYMKEDFTKRGEHYDIIFDAVGKYKKSLCTDALMPNGKYVSVNGMMAKVSKEDMNLLKQLAETEKLKPVIDRTYRLEEIAEAHIYVEKGHKKGNVSITLK
ncbi:NAD(P)-dependent alcohol dehydrogenase [Bacillus thuringiensis]|uniref:NAD(P)-dependent alcohol dehydrogenase n=1 Tax=Bacillus thuringiensis serovar toumanoffi TaxID=180862 RepID=A0ABD5HTG8_BACTU|nr:NAD(P)-dependent alcohol dehydrogenase [Bacillus thuringiensis]MCR6778206.1 NAD(P)-dependent alcohol dehydrogenase [Bacillus thuringiensis]MCR6862264.1 NAD(P)-dependent alcohol dehydrogenase [Bacillus thuringiensis]MCR6868980.1 NAD(P)-dependent alcohol dehydrogenase [Bacillus thuringiensis]MDW9208193.1 NAD(P)-dependent alcohol dehydrogenase [Bacillus thuringiensis serovar toumanoffi]MED2617653.1 NAD(P)-dependent alcohol dehydrogenase [Bacillus thuringiensis]